MSTAAQQAVDEITRLRHDLTSARVRNRTFERAILAAARASRIVGVIPGRDREHEYTIIYDNGVRVERRWTTERGWHDHQMESVADSVAARIDDLFTADGLTLAEIGMSVATPTDEDAPVPAALIAVVGARR